MFAIEYFVGSARGLWARGRKRYDTEAEALATAREEFLSQVAALAGVHIRRVVPA